ncbi:MAG: AAA family ATPase [Solirubrobacteraceae bacterium]|nr:AAA family ATPase [Solirubrobacteraceae bacterium]
MALTLPDERARPDPVSPPADASACELSVEIVALRWQAPEGGFAVAAAVTDEGEEVTLTGPIEHFHEGELLAARGAWRRHARHGWRFEVETAISRGPSGDEALARLLASVRHVGPSGAAWLLERHGKSVLDVLDADPRGRLREVPGIGPARIGAAVRSWELMRGRRALRLFLSEHHVPAAAATRIERALGCGAAGLLRADPFSAAAVEGVGFETADALARALGWDAAAPERLDAGILHALDRAGQDGHCVLPRAELERRAVALLRADVAGRVDQMLAAGRLAADGDLLAEPRMDALERRLARRAGELARAAPLLALGDGARPRHGPFVPSDDQWAVVDAVQGSRLAILTGGPGTGKTATMRAIVELLRAERRTVRLCAPTGKAARRLAEATGVQATTIHRLLGWLPGEGFEHGPDDPIPHTDLLVVDEASMLSVQLADALLGAVGPRTHVLLVGDTDQLAPVGPGRVLEDLIASGVAPTVRLTEVFRQAARSLIVRAAHAVNAGRRPPADAGADGVRDFFVIERADPQALFDEVVSLAVSRLPGHYGLDPIADVLVLSPMHRGPLGVDALNASLRERLNPDGRPIPGSALRVGDRVIQTRNDHERELMNGELGVLVHHDAERERSTFAGDDGRRLALDGEALATIRLAHAISVHKAQGSQAPAVVVPIVRGHAPMLTRNLVYTALTRAERVCVLVVQPGALERALERRDARRRHTRLARLAAAAAG